MVVTIDGPAGAGKSTVAKRLARRLGFFYLDTGALYRAVTLEALQRGIDLDSPQALGALARDLTIDFVEPDDAPPRVLCNGRDVTEALRTPDVTANIFHAADQPAVRLVLNETQRQFARGRDIVTEGRDQGTEVFVEAEVKFFLEASAEVRARRRMEDFRRGGCAMSHEQVLAQILERDRQDASRPMGALRRPPDAILVDTSDMSVEEVTETLARHVRNKLG